MNILTHAARWVSLAIFANRLTHLDKQDRQKNAMMYCLDSNPSNPVQASVDVPVDLFQLSAAVNIGHSFD